MVHSVRVFVTLKKSVYDPQGDAVKAALLSDGFEGVRSLRIGKLIDLEVEGESREACLAEVERMCRRLLVNGELETFRIQPAEDGDGACAGKADTCASQPAAAAAVEDSAR